MPQVLNAKVVGKSVEGAVYVGRPTKWGNPFSIGLHGSRDEVIEQFSRYLLNRPLLIASLGELRGKDLICWCAPAPCHADLLLELANDESLEA
jgi:hypothetical protein